jgi:alpha-tubulin suppressor-like RCC1 family protein
MKKTLGIFYILAFCYHITISQKICSGYHHNLIICANGKINSFGRNNFGQLGLGNSNDHNTPTLIGIHDIFFTNVSAGEFHSIALDSNGNVWTWGRNSEGQLGDSTYINRLIPKKIEGFDSIIQISADRLSSYALKKDGTLWSWGYNQNGQLGLGDTNRYNYPQQINIEIIKKISSYGGILALTNEGTVYGWGNYFLTQNTNTNLPVLLNDLSNIIDLAVGDNHFMVLNSENKIYSWGYNSFGQVGDGTDINSWIPTAINTNVKFKNIFAGVISSYALDIDNNLYGWGSNPEFSSQNVLSPTLINLNNVEFIVSGNGYRIVLQNNNILNSWGNNQWGQLGLGHNNVTSTATNITLNCQNINSIIPKNNLLDFKIIVKDYEIDIEFHNNVSLDISLFNLLGVELNNISVKDNSKISISRTNLPNGTYLIRFLSKEGEVYKKITFY